MKQLRPRETRDDILLIKPGSMGDIVHALPVAHALKSANPASRLTWIIDSRWAPLIQNVPCVDKIIEFPRTRFRGIAGWARAVQWFQSLASLNPDMAVDLQGLMRSALMTRFSRPKHSIGLSDAREGAARLVQETADVSGIRHAVDRYLAVLPLCGIPIPASPVFPLPQGDVPVGFPEGAVVIHPFARGQGKSLSDQSITELCEALAPLSVVICGQGSCPSKLPPQVTDFTNKTTLLELIGLLRGASAVISVDSGPMHLAAAIGKPLLSIHTWSDPRKVGPYSNAAWVWQGGGIRPQSLSDDAEIFQEKPMDSAAIAEIAQWARRNAVAESGFTKKSGESSGQASL